jgi:citrate lyase subunit beta / citryl-CoA lyase
MKNGNGVRPRPLIRSILSVPGSSPRFIAKAESVPADVIAFDLEDSVAPQEKAEARAAVARTIDRFPKNGRLAYVRPNDLDSGLLEDDLAAVVRPGLDGIHMPKVHGPDTIVHVDHYLTLLERMSGLPSGAIRLIAWIESARGVANVEAICGSSPRLVAVSVGSEDYAASLGVSRSAEATELAFARARVVNAAAAAGLIAVDGAETAVRNPDRFWQVSCAVRQLGFRGKFCIHPGQVELVNNVFGPSGTERAWAEKVVQAFEVARDRGVGAITVDGSMVDLPIYERARELLRWSDQVRAGRS